MMQPLRLSLGIVYVVVLILLACCDFLLAFWNVRALLRKFNDAFLIRPTLLNLDLPVVVSLPGGSVNTSEGV